MTGARSNAGFTLLELLVAMTLLGLLMALMLGGLRLGTRAWETGDNRIDDLSRLMTAQDFLRRQITEAYPANIADEGDQPEIHFAGEAGRLTFVSELPFYLAPGGFYELDIYTEREDDVRNLMIGWRLFDPNGEDFSDDEGEPSLLLRNIRDVRFSYYGRDDPDSQATWEEYWPPRGLAQLPELIQIQVTFHDGDDRLWPDMTITPRLRDATDSTR